MRALMYADWIVIRRTFLRYLLVTLLVMTPIVTMSNDDGELSAGVAVAAMSVAMITIYLAIGLFGADEANGWEQVRLTLPTTARQVVRSRYALAAIVTGAVVVIGTALGALVQMIIPLFHGTVMAPRGIAVIGLSALGTGIVSLGLLALEMPIIYHLGIAKGRMAITLPFMLCLLVTIEPVRNALLSVLEGLEGVAGSLGSPALLFAGGIVVVALLFLGSMRLSERLYAARDF